MRHLLVAILCIQIFALSDAVADGNRTIKSSQKGIRVQSAPGTSESAAGIGSLEYLEEANIIEEKLLPNGETWYRVRLRRHPGWRTTEQVGWVNGSQVFEINDAFNEEGDLPLQGPSNTNPEDCPPGQKPGQKRGQTGVTGQAETLQDIAKRALDQAPPVPKPAIATVSPSASSGGFIWPVGGTLRSGYGMRRHPIHGVVKLHNGTDIAGNAGKKVAAAKAGVVTKSAGGCSEGKKKCNGGAGNMITIDHGDGTQTKYLHLSPKCKLADKGQRVKQGEVIACVGSTGASTGPHLHFSVLKDGKYINPLSVLPKKRPAL